jgi:hypothetical protein
VSTMSTMSTMALDDLLSTVRPTRKTEHATQTGGEGDISYLIRIIPATTATSETE